MGREFDINADFDLSLRPRWRGPVREGFARQIAELAFHTVLIGASEDSVRLPGALRESFIDHLLRNRLEVPQVTIRPAVRPDADFTPFGWNAAAVELGSRYRRPPDHPPLAVVRRVNGRCFAADIEAELGDACVIGRCRSMAEVRELLARAPDAASGWVVKAEHANGGLGNRRLRSRRLDETDRRFVAALLEEDDVVLVEPWLRRLTDLCATFRVDRAGEPSRLLLHETVTTAEGAFIGALFEADSEVLRPWTGEMERVAAALARRLAAEGYFGAVCLDAFVWDDGGSPRLRPAVDLNARLHVSLPALRLWRSWGRQPVVLWRFFSRRKLRLPDDSGELAAALGAEAFDPDRRRGTLLSSPLLLDNGGHARRPHKLGVLFAGASRERVFGLERRFRERFER
jgi:hypothetical protein